MAATFGAQPQAQAMSQLPYQRLAQAMTGIKPSTEFQIQPGQQPGMDRAAADSLQSMAASGSPGAARDGLDAFGGGMAPSVADSGQPQAMAGTKAINGMTVGTVRNPVTGEWSMGQPPAGQPAPVAPASAPMAPEGQPRAVSDPFMSYREPPTRAPMQTGVETSLVGVEAGPNSLPGITTARPSMGDLPGVGERAADLSGLPGVGERTADLSGLNAIRTGLDTAGLADLQTDFGGQGDRVRNAMFERISGLVNPEHERVRSATASRLANQGIPEGSERWNEEMNRLDQQRSMSLERAGLDADISAGDQQAQLFQQALAARQQGVGERATDAGIGMQARTLMGGEQERAADRGFSQAATGRQLLGGEAERAADRGFSQATTGRQLLGGERERDADRLFNQSLGARGQLASERLTTRGQDVQDRASQRSADAQMASAQAQAGATASGHALQAAQAAAANDIARSRLGLDQEGQGFNQWLMASQFARGGVPQTNMGTPIPLDVTGAAGVAQQGANAQNQADAARNSGYWQLAGSLLGGAMGGKVKR